MRGAPKGKTAGPALVAVSGQLRVWFKYDDVFAKPKANLLVNLLSVVAYESPEASVLTQLFVMMVKEQASERVVSCRAVSHRAVSCRVVSSW